MTKNLSSTSKGDLLAAFALGLVVFLSCLLGIYTRPVGFLANFWPANAVMLGTLVRLPQSAGLLGWLVATFAFMAADILTGGTWFKSLILNAANLSGIAAAYITYTFFSDRVIGLQHPNSMLYLILIAVSGGAISGVIGGVSNPVLFDKGIFDGWLFWFVTEFVNYIAILPLVITMQLPKNENHNATFYYIRKDKYILPTASLLLSFVFSVIIGGPGAIAFPVPALLWCGLVYSVFATSFFTFIYAVWALSYISPSYIPDSLTSLDENTLISFRLGVSFIAIGPIMLSAVMRSRDHILDRLFSLATKDSLTGASNRNTFIETTSHKISEGEGPFALLMIDLDHFKSVNDNYGHAAGDKVLVCFSDRARSFLDQQDILGRLGGEEFAILVSKCSAQEALLIASRIHSAAREPIKFEENRTLVVTISVGLLIADRKENAEIDELLARADSLLYQAKKNGRDRIEFQHDLNLENRTVT